MNAYAMNRCCSKGRQRSYGHIYVSPSRGYSL